MDVTNRILVIGGALLATFLVLLIILLAWSAPQESIDRLADLAGYLDDHNTNASKLIVTFGGLILILVAALVVLFEVAPPETGLVRVARGGAGNVSIATEEIQHRLEEELAGLGPLTGVQAQVFARGNRAEVRLDLYVSASADIAATTDEAVRRVREVLEERMGVEIDGQPKAQIHYRELRMSRPGPAPSTGAPPRGSAGAFPPSAPPSVTPPPPPASGGSPLTSSEPAHESGEKRDT